MLFSFHSVQMIIFLSTAQLTDFKGIDHFTIFSLDLLRISMVLVNKISGYHHFRYL